MSWLDYVWFSFFGLGLLLILYLVLRVFIWDQKRTSSNYLIRTAEMMREEGIVALRDTPFLTEIVIDPRVEPRILKVQEVPGAEGEGFSGSFGRMIRFPISRFKNFEVGMPMYIQIIAPDPKGRGSIVMVLQLFPVFLISDGFWRINKVEDEDPNSRKGKLRPLRVFDFVVERETVGWVLPEPSSKLELGVAIKAPVSGLIVAKQIDNGEGIAKNDVPMLIGREVKRFPLKEETN